MAHMVIGELNNEIADLMEWQADTRKRRVGRASTLSTNFLLQIRGKQKYDTAKSRGA
jgi:hypothetical protein